jgi:hypothetical protein
VSSDALGALLKAQPEGKVMWVAIRGSSMRPILTGGESLKVRRCSPDALKIGDIAVMLRADGALVSHLVVATDPFRTESFIGTPDAPGLEVLARAIAVRRGKVVVPLPRPARFALLGLQRAWSLAARTRVTRSAYAALGTVISSELTANLRALLGQVEVDVLGPEALKDFAVGLSRWETLSGAALEALLREGVVVGARRHGRIVGCVCVTPDKVVRHAFLQRRAQGLGLEAVMLDRLLREAETRGLKPARAELHPSQQGFIAAAQGLALL